MPYGSEWHLLRYMGRHRHRLDAEIWAKTGGDVLDWLDHSWNPGGKPDYFSGPTLDAEWLQLDFLADDVLARRQWPNFWPTTRGNVQNWDAVGWLRVGTQLDLLLVEAKSYPGELKQRCKAKENGGLPQIRQALDDTKEAFGVPPALDWLCPYYQFCNRLAVLQHLTRHGVGARLLFIYFTGDTNPSGQCPADEAGWQPSLEAMYQHVGLTGQSPLEARVHKLFLPVVSG